MKNRPAIIASIMGVVMISLIALFVVSDGGPDDTNQLVGKPVPVIDTVDTEGRPFRTSDYRGRFLVVNFFATWCPPCKVEHPQLVSFSEAHERLGDASVVSVAFDESADKVREFFDEEGGDWPVLSNESGSLSTRFAVIALPESYLVAPDGTVIHKFIGGVTRSDIERKMEEYNSRPTTTTTTVAAGATDG